MKAVERGRIQVYTGDGKGKTTAALGLVMRAAGRGLRCAFVQFLKGGWQSGEYVSLERLLPPVPHMRFGRKCRYALFPGQPAQDCERCGQCFFDPAAATVEDEAEALFGEAAAAELLRSGEYDLLVLDEYSVILHFSLLSREMAEELLDSRGKCEIVITGRWAPQWLIDRADLVSEIKEVKHYWKAGLQAREGFEF
ncbi:MAG: cob(I)yrinic acid a,c-diamide adenosyltransferase [Candidatus Brocadiia bacterium]